ncbi:hypothetical protein F5B21DRAFT_354310 [Xylaria acuta]|nr:hypothetical protein F5B21DRAFT_354310 [Xylaria acuta]
MWIASVLDSINGYHHLNRVFQAKSFHAEHHRCQERDLPRSPECRKRHLATELGRADLISSHIDKAHIFTDEPPRTKNKPHRVTKPARRASKARQSHNYQSRQKRVFYLRPRCYPPQNVRSTAQTWPSRPPPHEHDDTMATSQTPKGGCESIAGVTGKRDAKSKREPLCFYGGAFPRSSYAKLPPKGKAQRAVRGLSPKAGLLRRRKDPKSLCVASIAICWARGL